MFEVEWGTGVSAGGRGPPWTASEVTLRKVTYSEDCVVTTLIVVTYVVLRVLMLRVRTQLYMVPAMSTGVQ